MRMPQRPGHSGLHAEGRNHGASRQIAQQEVSTHLHKPRSSQFSQGLSFRSHGRLSRFLRSFLGLLSAGMASGSLDSDHGASGNCAYVSTCSRSDAQPGFSEANIRIRSATFTGSLRAPAGTIIFVASPLAQGTPAPQTLQNDLDMSRPGTW